MRKIIFISIFILCHNLFASDITLKYNNFNSKIKFDSTKISYEDVNTNLSLTSRKCNAHIIERLIKGLNVKSRNLLLQKVQESPMVITIDGVENTIDQRSSVGLFFYNFIEEIKQAKIEENLNCL